MRIHITGPAGAGTTTLGFALARRLGLAHLDTDAFFWIASNPPYVHRRPILERLQLLRVAMEDADGWILSGSVLGWGDSLLDDADLVLDLYVPPDIRIARLLARERSRYGDDIAPGGLMYEQHIAFLAWASSYDDPQHGGRNRVSQEAWLATLRCRIMRLDGRLPVARLVDDVLATVTPGA